jgi:hypothetical protein
MIYYRYHHPMSVVFFRCDTGHVGWNERDDEKEKAEEAKSRWKCAKILHSRSVLLCVCLCLCGGVHNNNWEQSSR